MRKVFFSFNYEDVQRVMVVRNSWVFQGIESAGFIDKAEFEKVELGGEDAIARWIDKQIEGTSVTVILLGENTLNSKWVKYEIKKSYMKGNAIIAVRISNIKDLDGNTSKIDYSDTFKYINLDYNKSNSLNNIIVDLRDYTKEDGYNNLGKWIERAAKKKGK